MEKTYILELTHMYNGCTHYIEANSPEECFAEAKRQGYSLGIWEAFITY